MPFARRRQLFVLSKFRAPDGTVAEIVGAGRYNKKKAEKAPAGWYDRESELIE